jgi:tetratricopeptide (TPR) repeat protein
LSLIKRQKKDDQILLGMHDLVQYLVQNKLMDDAQRHIWLKAAITLICVAFKEIGYPGCREAWPACEVFVNQIQALAKNCEKHKIENDDLVEAQAGVAHYFESLGQYADAGVLQEAIYEHYRMKGGQIDYQTLEAAKDLGFTYLALDRLEDAGSLFEMVHQANKEQWGENHPRVLRSMWNLTSVAMALGQNQEAERLCRLALQGQELHADDGFKQLDTLYSAHFLGSIYQDQGRYQEAEIMFRKVLDRPERIPGDVEYTCTIFAVERLAVNYCLQQRYQEAEPLFRRAYKDREMRKGETHALTLRVALSLALVCAQNGHYDDAEALYCHVLLTAGSKLGPNHNKTLHAVEHLAQLRVRQGQNAEAEELMLRLLEGHKQSCGLDHPRTILTEKRLETMKETGTLDLPCWDHTFW